MRRGLTIAILAAALTLAVPMQAQRGGGMGGRGAVGHGPGVSGRPAQTMPASRFAGVPSSSRVIVNGGRFGVRSRPPFFFNGRRCFGAFPCRNGLFFNNGFGFGFPGVGLGYVPGFYPSDYDQQSQQPIVVNGGNDQGNTQLAMEVQRLSDQIEFMREEQNRQAQARQPGGSLSARSAVSTTFIFRNGHRMTTENYAIAGQTLWVFNEGAAKRFALSEVDRGATEQINADNGVDLHLPESAP